MPAHEVIDRTYGKKSFTLDYMDRIDIKFESGREAERFYWWMKTNPPAHWSVLEDGGESPLPPFFVLLLVFDCIGYSYVIA